MLSMLSMLIEDLEYDWLLYECPDHPSSYRLLEWFEYSNIMTGVGDQDG